MGRGKSRSNRKRAATQTERISDEEFELRFEKEFDFSKAKRGPVIPIPAGKTRITIRIDDDILDWFRKQVNDAGGGNYQTTMNQALREFIERGALEPMLRRIVREELRCLKLRR